MKSFFVCLLVGYVCATGSLTSNAWKSNTEYQYKVHGRTLAALHDVADQYVGVLVRANLRINPRTNDLLNAQITNPEYAQIHVNLPGGWESEIPQEQLHYKPLPLNNKPFEIELVNGVVKQVLVEKNIPNWEANLIKSLVSQIQVDMQGQNLMSSRYNQKPEMNENSGNYKTMEDTVTGKCETLYDVFPLPEHVLQNRPQIAPLPDLKGDGEIIGIVKTKNYSNCDQIVEAHFGLPETFTENINGNLKNFLSKSSISLVVISGNLKRYTIQSSVTTNKIIVSPTLYNSQNGMVVSRFNITLERVQSSTEEKPKLQSPVSVGNLVYSYNSPFAAENQVHAGKPNTVRQSVNRNEIDFDSESSEERRNHEKRERSTRSIHSDNWGRDVSSSDSSEETSDNSYDADDYQPMPTLQHAPENPLLPLFIGNRGRSVKFAIEPAQSIVRIVQELAHQIENPNLIPKDQLLSRFTLLVDLIRMMNAAELKEIGQKLFDKKQQQQENVNAQLAWKVYRDAVTESGTGPALLTIKEWIQTKKISGEEAAAILASLANNVSHPTEEYVRVFYEMSTNAQVKSQKYLNETAILATSDLVRIAFVNYQHEKSRSLKSFRKLSSELTKYNFITKEYIPYLSQMLQEAQQNDDSKKIQVCIRALGNVAHPQILSVFKPYLEGERPLTDFQRLLMVVAMDHLVYTYPKEARSVLYKIYSNTGDSTQVRTAAVFQFMRTQPPASMLQRMAEYTHVEPSKHVRCAIKSSIEAASRLKGHQHTELAANARSAIKMLNPETYGQQYAHASLYEHVFEHLNLYYKQYMSVMRGEDNIIPNYLYYSMHINEGGLSQKLMSMNAMVSSVRSLIALVQENLPIESPEIAKEQSNKVAQQWVDKIAKLLNIQVDDDVKVEANLLFQHLGYKRFFALDKHSFEQIPTLLREAFVALRDGQKFNYTKLYNDEDITINIPTEMSFPFTFTVRKPTLINIGGQVQIGPNTKDNVMLNSEVELLYSSKIESQIGFVTPFDSQMYVAGFDRNIQVHLPVSVRVTYNLKEQLLNMKLAPLYPEQNNKIIHYSTWPYTSNINLLTVSDLAKQQRHIVHVRPHQESEYTYGQENGIAYRMKVESEQSPAEWRILNNMAEKYNVLSPIVFVWKSWLSNSLHASNLNVEYVHELSASRYVSIDMSHRHADQTEEVSKNTNLAKVPFEQRVTRQIEALNVVRSDIDLADGKVYDVAVQFSGENQPKYVATLSHAKSHAENHFRQLLFLAKYGRNPYQIWVSAYTKGTQSPALDFVKALQSDSHLNTEIKMKFGESYQHGAEINVNARFEKSLERRQALQSSPMAQLYARQMEQNMHQTPIGANLTVQATLMDRLNIRAQFDRVDDVTRNMTEKLWSTIQHFGYKYLERNQVNATGSGSTQKINIHVEFEPENFESANITVQTPKSDVVFRNVLIKNKAIRSLVAIRPESNPLRNYYAAMYQRIESETAAVLEGSSVTTFNNRTYQVALGHCYHIFLQTVKHLQREIQDNDLRYTILVRDSEQEKYKDVKILFGYEGYSRELKLQPNYDHQAPYSAENPAVVVYLDQNRIEVPVKDGYYVKDSNNKVYARIYLQPSGYVRIEFPHDLVVYYDSLIVKVTLHDQYQGQTRGLVGRNNNEPWLDFTCPRNTLLQDQRQFAASWAIVDETCQGPAVEQQKRALAAHSAQRKTMFINVISDKDAHNHEKKTECHTKHQTRYTIENNGKTICFTTRAIPVCQKGCRHSKNSEKTVDVHCLKRTSTVNLYKQQIDKGASPDFSGKPVTKSIKIKIPITCA
ncbi:vitellogenin-like isoform X2 [Chrysoperla carnea]|uniref:vitellogenin-like isoform X2 n=1 Tax=Chrysoperla carnea TaxID=189513 RepID=UPI001D0840B0|nr:vitellogenin-like isoform X2 [Chrysoperla carnea]